WPRFVGEEPRAPDTAPQAQKILRNPPKRWATWPINGIEVTSSQRVETYGGYNSRVALSEDISMPAIAQKEAIRGSQKWLQMLVNRCPNLLDQSLRPYLKMTARDTFTWRSPLREDCYTEYRDEDFLEQVSTRLEQRGLDSFWPHRGPVWDGLARTSRGDVILVEAKSHVSELASFCQARPQALKLIQNSLAEAADFFGATSPGNWSRGYYQYANRLAHLYLLRHLNGIPAWLVFLYFVNDFEMDGPKSEAEWRSAIAHVHDHLGIKSTSLRPHVIDLYVDVTALESELACR
ncbi:MAG: hypothetical protein ABIJ61_14720, partial [bacterium]